MKRKQLFAALAAALLGIVCTMSAQQTVHSSLVYPGKGGKLEYKPYTPQGDILPDFSYCGYMRGEAPIPNAKVVVTLSPDPKSEDDTQRIQGAIDQVGRQKPGKDGLRGAVLLKKGEYRLGSSLKLRDSGVVLRGEGDGEDGTVLVATARRKYTLMIVGTENRPKRDTNSQTSITDAYVPSGTRTFTVTDGSKYEVGDQIIVERPSTAEWIAAIGMDRIEPYWALLSSLSPKDREEKRKAGKVSEDGKRYNSTIQWAPGSKNIKYERTVTEVKGNTITVDIPLTNAFQQEYGGGRVYKYRYDDRPQQIGIENLRGTSEYDPSVTASLPYLKDYPSDENHARTFISIGTCENVWARNLTCEVFSHGISVRAYAKYATIEHCRYLDPVSIIAGGWRYPFLIGGQLSLVIDCYARNGRHDFVLGATVAGPNAFVNSVGEMAHAASEPHQRWATGCLWDNCTVSGPMGYFSISNRGRYGTGHGWAGAQMVMWNCTTQVAIVMAPPTAMNFSIGTQAMETEWSKSNPEYLQSLINRINQVSGQDMRYEGMPAVGSGFIEHSNQSVSPKSLYYAQLKDRLGSKTPSARKSR